MFILPLRGGGHFQFDIVILPFPSLDQYQHECVEVPLYHALCRKIILFTRITVYLCYVLIYICIFQASTSYHPIPVDMIYLPTPPCELAPVQFQHSQCLVDIDLSYSTIRKYKSWNLHIQYISLRRWFFSEPRIIVYCYPHATINLSFMRPDLSLTSMTRYKHLGQFAPLGGEQAAAELPGDWVSMGRSTQWLWYSVYARWPAYFALVTWIFSLHVR